MDIVIIFLLLMIFTAYLKTIAENQLQLDSPNFIWVLFFVHTILSGVYFIYAFTSRSDSVVYYNNAIDGENWLYFFRTGSPFITFIAYPFARYLSLSYYAIMLLFSYFGFLACLLFYLAAKENVYLKNVWNNYSYVELVFLLPNLHFWSGSLGKGSVILFGIAMFIYGLSRFNNRIFFIAIGGFFTYMVRPHILFTLILSSILGVIITSSGLKWYIRLTILLAGALIFYLISDSVLLYTNSESFDIVSSSNLSLRAQKLSTASSGVDINNYNIVFKLFTFWFRPLFFDGLGALGFIVSFENAVCLFMLFIIIREAFSSWKKWNGWFRICVIAFLLGSFILAQVSGNLGIAMRQKAQMMPLFFIIYLKAMSYRGQIQTALTRR